jgi:hypothetical protein
VISIRPVDWPEKPLARVETPPDSLIMQAVSSKELNQGGWQKMNGEYLHTKICLRIQFLQHVWSQ